MPKINKSEPVVESTRSFTKRFGGAPEVYGEVVATASVTNGKFETHIQPPGLGWPADVSGEIIRKIQQAAEWALDQEAALRS
jgi:hypothetical protein